LERFDKEKVIRWLEELNVHIVPIGSPDVKAVLLVREEDYEEMAKHLRLPDAARRQLKALQEQNSELLRRIDDLRVINRAKLILVSHLGMTENAAHKYIEKRAMDSRLSKREVAEGILKTYEN
jgi:AmiR/NasT family two-component response regulator